MNYQSLYNKTALYPSPDYQTSFKLTGLSGQEKKFNIDFQDDSHLGLPIRMILAFCSREVQNRISKWRLWRQYWISDQNKFSYF